MRKRKTFLGFVLILLIISGVGYIGYSFWINPGMLSMLGINNTNSSGSGNSMNMNNMPSNTTTMSGVDSSNMNMQGMNMENPGVAKSSNNVLNNAQLNQIALQNKDTLYPFITQITDAINQITINPYLNITVPGLVANSSNIQPQGNATVNVYPNGTNSVNVAPSGTPNNQNQSANTNNTGVNKPTVYNQYKLEQIHTSIFRLSQGIMLLDELNNDLNTQSSIVEPNPPGYETYLLRYNSALQNKVKLSSALSLLNSATTIINVNPYSSDNGYLYNPQAMEQLDRGIYKLAQAMGIASKIKNDYTDQVSRAAYDLNNYNSMVSMNMSSQSGVGSSFSLSNLPFVFTVILIVMIIALIIGIFGTINSMLRPRDKK